jgi:hypothetical protein
MQLCENENADAQNCWIDRGVIVAQLTYWMAVASVPYGIEFLCLCCAELMVRSRHCVPFHQNHLLHQVLDRLVYFVILAQKPNNRWLRSVSRVAMFSIAASNVVNLCFMATNANYLSAASSSYSQLVPMVRAPDFSDQLLQCLFLDRCRLKEVFLSATGDVNQGLRVQSYASVCEGFSLVTILLLFMVSGAYCIRRFNESNTNLKNTVGRKNNSVRVRILGAVVTVFVAFLIRSWYAVVLAISRHNNTIRTPFDEDFKRCFDFCNSCQESGVIVQAWLFYTPEFSVSIMLLSSPLTLLIALWAMTTHDALMSFRSCCWKSTSSGHEALISV